MAVELKVSTPALQVHGLTKDYVGERALKGVSFEVPSGSLFGIIGADGAGKSTLMNTLATLLEADAGEATILGFDLKKDFRALRQRLAFMPQRFSLYPDLTVRENLDFFADLYAFTPAAKKIRMQELLAFSGLAPFQQRRAGLLSGGMKQKLALSCCLLHHPTLVFLDEPTVGVDPVARRDFWILLKSLQDQGVTLVLSTPYMDEAARCDALILLHHGSILESGTPEAMLSRYPYDLYRIRGMQSLAFSARQLPPPGVALVYPTGGYLHAAFEKEIVDPKPRREPWTLFPEASASEKVEPSIEDLLFALLSREGGVTR